MPKPNNVVLHNQELSKPGLPETIFTCFAKTRVPSSKRFHWRNTVQYSKQQPRFVPRVSHLPPPPPCSGIMGKSRDTENHEERRNRTSRLVVCFRCMFVHKVLFAFLEFMHPRLLLVSSAIRLHPMGVQTKLLSIPFSTIQIFSYPKDR